MKKRHNIIKHKHKFANRIVKKRPLFLVKKQVRKPKILKIKYNGLRPSMMRKMLISVRRTY